MLFNCFALWQFSQEDKKGASEDCRTLIPGGKFVACKDQPPFVCWEVLRSGQLSEQLGAILTCRLASASLLAVF